MEELTSKQHMLRYLKVPEGQYIGQHPPQECLKEQEVDPRQEGEEERELERERDEMGEMEAQGQVAGRVCFDA